MNSITDGETVNTTPQLRPMSIGEGVTPDDADSGDAGCAAQERAQQLVAQLNATRRTQQQQTTGFADAAQRFGVDLAHVWMDNGWRPGDEPPKAKIVDDARIGNANELLPAATWIYPPAARQRKREELHRLAANDIGIDLDRPPDWLEIAGSSNRPRLASPSELRARTTEREEIVRGVLVAGSVCMVNAKRKGGKTLLVGNMGLSVATGTPFLESAPFAVDRPRPAAMYVRETSAAEFLGKIDAMIEGKLRSPIPAESQALLRERFEQNFKVVDEWTPDLSDPASVQDWASEIIDLGIAERRGLVVIDPFKLSIGKAARDLSNDAITGQILLDAAAAVRPATLIVVNHAVIGRGTQQTDWPSLDDASYGGVPNFCRQWICMDQRIPWDSESRTFDLRVHIGGSTGQAGGDFNVVMREGAHPDTARLLGTPSSGWAVQVRPRRDLITQQQREADDMANAETQREAELIFAAIQGAEDGTTRTTLIRGEHHVDGIGAAGVTRALRALQAANRVETRNGRLYVREASNDGTTTQ